MKADLIQALVVEALRTGEASLPEAPHLRVVRTRKGWVLHSELTGSRAGEHEPRCDSSRTEKDYSLFGACYALVKEVMP